MSAATIRDRIAAKIANLSHASNANVYSNGSIVSAKVAPWPQETDANTIHAMVGRGTSLHSGGTGNQRVNRAIDVEWRFSALDMAEAERLIDALEDEIIVEFSSGITLGGAAIDSEYLGSDRPVEIDEDDRQWVQWLCHFNARERFATEMTP